VRSDDITLSYGVILKKPKDVASILWDDVEFVPSIDNLVLLVYSKGKLVARIVSKLRRKRRKKKCDASS